MGAELAGLRAVGVPLDDEWRLDLGRVREADAGRALLIWTNDPGNPTSAVAGGLRTESQVSWARERGIVVAADECYAEFAGEVGPPATALGGGPAGVLACHSLSKRSNMAGFRVGFVAGDAELVAYLGLVRKHSGLMVPAPVQAAAAAALGDDEHVVAQRERYEQRRKLMLDGLAGHGLVHDGGPGLFYLWLRAAESTDDGWEVAARLAEAGTLVAPGGLYGAAGADHVRLALTQPNDRLELALERLAESSR
jgi:aspartate/methionine/tyrosine aminotransferase